MDLIKCPNCGEKIDANSLNCEYCGITIIENTRNVDHEIVNKPEISNDRKVINKNSVEKNIHFFLTYAEVIRVLCFVLAAVIFVICLCSGEGEAILSGIILSITFVLTGIISAPFLEWMAYLLKNTYEINEKLNRKK